MSEAATLAGSMRCNCATLRKAARQVTSLYDGYLQDSGLTIGQFAVLDEIEGYADKSPPLLGALAQALVMDRTTLSHTLKPLERDNLLRVEPDPDDRRARRVRLTALGRERAALARSSWLEAQAHFARAFGQDQAIALQALLRMVTDADFEATRSRQLP